MPNTTTRFATSPESIFSRREFPVDGAAGEGFTNTGDALVISPILLAKYLAAAKLIASHAVLLSDGIRFSPSTMRRDWTDEAIAEIRKTYRELNHGDESGSLDFRPYLAATVKVRDDVIAGKTSIAAVATQEKLNAKYLQAVWSAFTVKDPAYPLDELQVRWRSATAKDIDPLAKEIEVWQSRLWRHEKIGSYMAPAWQTAANPKPVEKVDEKKPPAPTEAFVAGADVRALDPKKLEQGFATFRECFPQFLHYPRIVPDDEIICLRMYYREDDQLVRLFLNDDERQRLDRVWDQLHFVSQEAIVEERNFPSFMGFVSQENSKEGIKKVEDAVSPKIRANAAAFATAVTMAEPKQLEAVLEFAARAYRRPLADSEAKRLRNLYAVLRKKNLPPDEAIHGVLTAVLISPTFLYRGELPAAGGEPLPVSNWELATRLSYFLWASLPDEPLRRVAASGRLTDPQVLAAETARMLHDPKARGLATEFAAQWLHVRDIRQNREKNEKLFPSFNDGSAQDLFEESILFLQDLMQNDRSLSNLIDCDYTFLE